MNQAQSTRLINLKIGNDVLVLIVINVTIAKQGVEISLHIPH